MKILQIANKFPYPAKDGGSIATLGLGKSLAAEGHEVTILALNTSKHYFDPACLPADMSENIRFIGVPVNTDISIFRLARNLFFSSLPYNAERFISKDFETKLTGLLGQEDFDIIQLEGLYMAPYLDAIRAHSRAKVLMRAHNIEHEIWDRTVARQKGLKKRYIRVLADRIRKMELFYLNRYDAVLPITARDGRMLQSLGCKLPLHVVPMGVNASELTPDHGPLEFPSVFHIGALDWIPNQEGLQWFFEEVWGRILEKYPGVKFYLAGRNAPDHFRSLPYRNIDFIGEVDDAYEFIRSRAVMVVPLLSGSGMRIKIIEGMALGKAIVTTSIGTEGIETTHGKNILIADDPVNFAENVCRLIEDQAFCIEIGENARKFVVKEYDNRSISHALTEFYHKLQR
jgi:glycosyltransferase involved in cell wall biosynthesis